MKNLILLLFLVFSTVLFSQPDVRSFEVTSNTGQSYTSGSRFDYDFEIKGNYGYGEIKLYVYYESVTSNNLIGLIRWNYEGEDYLNFPSYTLKSMWLNAGTVWQNRSFSIPGHTFIMRAYYNGTFKQLTYTAPEEKPDLSFNLQGSTITSNCSSCDVFFDLIGTDRHFINYSSGIASISVLVDNMGNKSSQATTVGVYYSTDNIYSSSDTFIKSFSLNSIGAGSSKYSSGALFSSDFNLGPNTNFWLIFRLDDNQTNSEFDEANNTFPIRFRIN